MLANAELDFVIALNGQIIPIEVKAGATGSLKSLHQFMGEKQSPVAVRLDASQPIETQITATIQHKKQKKVIKYPLLSLPLYLVEQLDTIIDQYLHH